MVHCWSVSHLSFFTKHMSSLSHYHLLIITFSSKDDVPLQRTCKRLFEHCSVIKRRNKGSGQPQLQSQRPHPQNINRKSACRNHHNNSLPPYTLMRYLKQFECRWLNRVWHHLNQKQINLRQKPASSFRIEPVKKSIPIWRRLCLVNRYHFHSLWHWQMQC